MRWNNAGTVTQTGETVIGDGIGATGIITNCAVAIYDITTDTGIETAAGGTGYFVNAGLLEKTGGTGTSTIESAVQNRGTIAVESETLDLAGKVTQAGALDIGDTATLTIDGSVSASQTVSFSGGGGHLVIDNLGGFSAGLSGFGANDEIDLATFAFVTGEKLTFTENADKTKGVLVVAEGALRARITLFGQYAAAGFARSTDTGTGTDITYTPPTADPHLAAARH